jgi:hypothetical protein
MTWQRGKFGYWAKACDFQARDLNNSKLSAASCGQKCSNTPNCTHYTWSTYNLGTCWMKYGPVNTTNAFYTNDFTMICGILSGNKPFFLIKKSITKNCDHMHRPEITEVKLE